LEWSMLDESSWWKIDVISASQIKIEFSNMKDFILTRNKREYRIALKTHNIWQDYLWEIVDNFYVTRVWFDDIKWLTTWDSLSEISFTQKWANNSVLPIELIINQNNYSWINSVEFNILWNFWNNLAYQSWNNKSVNIEELRFRPYWSQYLDEYSYELINRDFPEQSVVGVYSNWFLTFEVSDLGENARTITDSKNWEDFEISMTHPIRKDNINLNLQRDWILFTISNHLWPITTRFEKTIDLESNNN
jgi:hypothetical protein